MRALVEALSLFLTRFRVQIGSYCGRDTLPRYERLSQDRLIRLPVRCDEENHAGCVSPTPRLLRRG